jgi:hypothetical protein
MFFEHLQVNEHPKKHNKRMSDSLLQFYFLKKLALDPSLIQPCIFLIFNCFKQFKT